MREDQVVTERLRAVMAATPLRVRDETTAGHGRARPAAARSRYDSALDDLSEVGEPLNWSDIVPGWPDDVDLDPIPEPPEEAEPPPRIKLGATPRVELGGSPRKSEADHTGGYPPGTPWASPPGAVPADRPLPRAAPVDRQTPRAEPVGLPEQQRPPAETVAAARPAAEAVPIERPPAVAARAARPPAPTVTSLDSDTDPFPSHLGDFMDEAEPFRSYRAPAVRPAGPERRPLPPPAWVLPESEDPPSESAGHAGPAWPVSPGPAGRAGPAWPVSPGPAGAEMYPEDEEPALGTAGAFGGERRFGLGAFDPGRRGVKALAAVAVVVIVIAAFLAWRARPQVDTVAAPTFDTAGATAGTATATEPGGGAAPAPSGTSVAEVVVAVGGKVRKPGLVRLSPGARVADALTAAGGADPGVDVAMLNLARKVVDGELILVGVTPSPGVIVPTGPAASNATAPAGGPLNLNTATLADLDALPGVGPVLAQRILDARDAQGGFKSVNDLRKVDGIGDARFEQLKDLVTV